MSEQTVKGKPLYVGLAEKKDERVNRLAQRYKGEKGQKGGLVTFDGKGMMPGKGGMMAGPQAGASMAMQGYPGYNANAMQQPMNNGSDRCHLSFASHRFYLPQAVDVG